MLDKWQFWTALYLVSAVLFSQCFKKANRKMKNATYLTLLLEGFTALFALVFIPFFNLEFSINPLTYLILGIVCVIYAVTDRLNIEARYGLEPSTFSMLKQLSTVFIIIFGIVFMKHELVIHKLIGAGIIIIANLLLAFNKGKFRFNKYFIMCVISNLLFAIAMLINMNISSEFNVAIYTFFTVGIPFCFIALFNRVKFKELKTEQIALANTKELRSLEEEFRLSNRFESDKTQEVEEKITTELERLSENLNDEEYCSSQIKKIKLLVQKRQIILINELNSRK